MKSLDDADDKRFSAQFGCLVEQGQFDVLVIGLMNNREGVVKIYRKMHKLEGSYKKA